MSELVHFKHSFCQFKPDEIQSTADTVSPTVSQSCHKVNLLYHSSLVYRLV